MRRIRTTTRIELSDDRGVFMISVAAELAEMHPQTLRMYEQRGLIEPKRSPKGTRLYSQADVERLRRIQQMTAEMGMNLAGVERVFELEEQLAADDARRCAGWRSAPASWRARSSGWRSCAARCARRSSRTCAAARSCRSNDAQPPARRAQNPRRATEPGRRRRTDAARPLHDQVPGGDPGRPPAGRGPRRTRRRRPSTCSRCCSSSRRASSPRAAQGRRRPGARSARP